MSEHYRSKGTCNSKKKHNTWIPEFGHINLGSQFFISPLNIRAFYVFKNHNSPQSHQSQQHQSILSISENQTTCMWSECRCLEKNSASYPLKKYIIGNLTIAFDIAWKCENIFVVLPHKLMLFHSHMRLPVTYKTSQGGVQDGQPFCIPVESRIPVVISFKASQSKLVNRQGQTKG